VEGLPGAKPVAAVFSFGSSANTSSTSPNAVGKDESQLTSAFAFGQTPMSATNSNPAFSFGAPTNPFGDLAVSAELVVVDVAADPEPGK
jgi:hypothetical protein